MYIETNKTNIYTKMKRHHKQGEKNKLKGENLINLKRKA
jgi:hypothetical protein